jgi:hypothetical protein
MEPVGSSFLLQNYKMLNYKRQQFLKSPPEDIKFYCSFTLRPYLQFAEQLQLFPCEYLEF